MEKKIRLAIVDDHEIVRMGINHVLQGESGICIVGEAENGEEALVMARKEKPHVILVDVKLPDISGIEVVHRLKHDPETSDVQAIILTVYDDLEIAAEAIRAGAIGYILKDCAGEELASAVESVAAGHVFLCPDLADALVQDYLERRENGRAPASILSPREREVLQLVAEGNTTKQIASELGLSAKTVEAHRRSMMDKLDIHSVAELTKFALKEGLTSLE